MPKFQGVASVQPCISLLAPLRKSFKIFNLVADRNRVAYRKVGFWH